MKDSPVTLYLGDDKIDLREAEEMPLDELTGTTITEKVAIQITNVFMYQESERFFLLLFIYSFGKQVELDEMPGLELIVEEEVRSHLGCLCVI